MTSLIVVNRTLSVHTFITLDILFWQTAVWQLKGRSTCYNLMTVSSMPVTQIMGGLALLPDQERKNKNRDWLDIQVASLLHSVLSWMKVSLASLFPTVPWILVFSQSQASPLSPPPQKSRMWPLFQQLGESAPQSEAFFLSHAVIIFPCPSSFP